MRVLYITLGERSTDGIIRTQVGHLLRALAREHSVTWVACVPAHRISESLGSSVEDSLSGVRRIVLPIPVRNLWMSPRMAQVLARLCCQLVRRVTREGFDLVHGRGYPAAEVARYCAHSLDIPWVFDPRGLYPEEMPMMAPAHLQKHQTWWRQREAEYWADASEVVVVSETMADYFRRAHGPRRCHVIPSHGGSISAAVIDETDHVARAVYVGSLNSWVFSKDIAELYLRVASGLEFPMNLTVVTRTDHASVLSQLVEAGVDASSVELIAAVPEEIPSILSRATIGLIPLEDHLRDRVCWPVKFSECLMAGLPVAAWSSDCSWVSYAESVGALVRADRGSCSPVLVRGCADAAARLAIRQQVAGRVSLESHVVATSLVWRRASECREA